MVRISSNSVDPSSQRGRVSGESGVHPCLPSNDRDHTFTPTACLFQPSVYICSPPRDLPLLVERYLFHTTLDANPNSASAGTMSKEHTRPSASLIPPTLTALLGLTGLATAQTLFSPPEQSMPSDRLACSRQMPHTLAPITTR
jgi:hypothetical protein